MNPYLTKAIAVSICLFFSSLTYSQTASVEYFEASAIVKAENASDITFVTSVSYFESADSLSFTIRNAANEPVYAAGNTIEAWKDANAYRIEGSVLYLTIAAGTFNELGTYSSEVILKNDNGEVLTYTSR